MKKKLLLALAIGGSQLFGQVYTAGTHYSNYNDIVPDSLLSYQTVPFTNDTYSLNIFGGSGYELSFTARGSVSSGGSQQFIRIETIHPDISVRFGRWDSVWVPGSSSWNVTKVAKPLLAGEVINAPGSVWETGILYLTDHSSAQGGTKNVNDFVGGDKYIGLKYVDQNFYNSVYFGWIWVKCASEDSCYVKEYSRSALITSVPKLENEKLSVYPNPVSDVMYLKNVTSGPNSDFTISVTNMLGENIPVVVSEKGETIEVKFSEDTLPGCYFITCNKEGDSSKMKFIKTN